jgi:plasmid stabilization system protein ParE
MTIARVTLSRPASNDLDAIWDYLAGEASEAIADFVIARLFEAMDRTAEAPFMYRRTEFPGRPRRLNVFDYAIFYEPGDPGEGIVVWRVVHSRRSLSRLIRRPAGLKKETDRR